MRNPSSAGKPVWLRPTRMPGLLSILLPLFLLWMATAHADPQRVNLAVAKLDAGAVSISDLRVELLQPDAEDLLGHEVSMPVHLRIGRLQLIDFDYRLRDLDWQCALSRLDADGWGCSGSLRARGFAEGALDLSLTPQRLLLHPQGADLAIALERAGEARALAVLPWQDDSNAAAVLARVLAPQLADMPRWLVLPAGSGLRRTLRLPAAAAERLRDVVSFEIDRQTPFSAQTAVFDARVVALRDDGQLDAELVVVPRRTLDDALAALGPVADTLAGVDLDDGSGQALGIDLLPGAGCTARIRGGAGTCCWRRSRCAR